VALGTALASAFAGAVALAVMLALSVERPPSEIELCTRSRDALANGAFMWMVNN
jgi:hypothetical protein